MNEIEQLTALRKARSILSAAIHEIDNSPAPPGQTRLAVSVRLALAILYLGDQMRQIPRRAAAEHSHVSRPRYSGVDS